MCLHKKNPATGGSGSTSSPLLFLAGDENHCYLQKKHKRQSILIFFLFLICFSLPFLAQSSFTAFSLLCFRPRKTKGSSAIRLLLMADLVVVVFYGRCWVVDDWWICDRPIERDDRSWLVCGRCC
ncbi:hypothetical protein Peur_008442 [Populus x canadensis]